MPNACSTTAMLATAFQGRRVSWPEHISSSTVHSAVAYHGVSSLLHEHLDLISDWPEALHTALRTEAHGRAIWELRHGMLLRHVIETLRIAGVRPVLIKGTALAYGYYARPHLRTRADTDLVILPAQRDIVRKELERLGFKVDRSALGNFASSQATFTLSTPELGAHSLDLHWAINNSALIARTISVQELHQAATRLPALSETALAASPVHALLLACLHRVAHQTAPYFSNGQAFFGGDRLIWLFDIHLLASSLTDAQWQELIALVRARGARAVLLDGLATASSHFGTVYPEHELRDRMHEGRADRLARYMRSGSLERNWLDLTAFDRIRDRLGWLSEVIFPAKAYMQDRYAHTRYQWLPWLYLRRAVLGLTKHVNRSHVR